MTDTGNAFGNEFDLYHFKSFHQTLQKTLAKIFISAHIFMKNVRTQKNVVNGGTPNTLPFLRIVELSLFTLTDLTFMLHFNISIVINNSIAEIVASFNL